MTKLNYVMTKLNYVMTKLNCVIKVPPFLKKVFLKKKKQSQKNFSKFS